MRNFKISSTAFQEEYKVQASDDGKSVSMEAEGKQWLSSFLKNFSVDITDHDDTFNIQYRDQEGNMKYNLHLTLSEFSEIRMAMNIANKLNSKAFSKYKLTELVEKTEDI